jgi:hypothetical protein
VARDPLIARHGSEQAGVSRAALLIVGAVVAAVVVLAAGALRSGPGASASPSAGSSGALGSLGFASLPATQTVAPTIETTPAPPEPTAIPDLRGEFVGALGLVELCPILYQQDGVFELILPGAYRSRIHDGRIQILNAVGAVLAAEGDLLGIDGRVREGGSVCMAGPQLHVSKIVDILRREEE